jgi:hypothetical protein
MDAVIQNLNDRFGGIRVLDQITSRNQLYQAGIIDLGPLFIIRLE